MIKLKGKRTSPGAICAWMREKYQYEPALVQIPRFEPETREADSREWVTYFKAQKAVWDLYKLTNVKGWTEWAGCRTYSLTYKPADLTISLGEELVDVVWNPIGFRYYNKSRVSVITCIWEWLETELAVLPHVPTEWLITTATNRSTALLLHRLRQEYEAGASMQTLETIIREAV